MPEVDWTNVGSCLLPCYEALSYEHKKNAFLNEVLKKELYVKKSNGFENSYKPDHVYKLKKALDGLKQAPRVMR